VIYVDTPFKVEKSQYPEAPHVFIGNYSAHLTADTQEELVAYAVRIGMKAKWLQHSNTYSFHFDVTGKFLRIVTDDPLVKKITSRELAKMLIDRRQAFLVSRYPQLRLSDPSHQS
jgi:hypothetical protein